MKSLQRGSCFLSVFILLFASLSPAQAAAPAAPQDAVVGTGTTASCTESAFNTALMAVSAGGTITFNCGGPAGITLSAVKTISAPVTILGGDAINLDGNNVTRIFNVSVTGALTLTHITLSRGRSLGADGGAIDNQGKLRMDYVTVQNSVTDKNGGAIFTAGPITITNSTFLLNIAANAGAILINQVGLVASISNTQFNGNQSSVPGGGGGAIWVGPQSGLVLTDGSFSTNSAPGGGAIFVNASATATLQGSAGSLNFVGNQGTDSGGAIYNMGTLTVRKARFINNQVPKTNLLQGFGAAIYNYGNLTVENSYFGGNGGRWGGAIYTGNANPQTENISISRSTFEYNTAQMDGGGLFDDDKNTVITITQTTFNNNSANTGGGLTNLGGRMTVADSSIFSNTATTYGGGMYITALGGITGTGYINGRNLTIAYNFAGSGRGGGLYNAALLDLQNLTVVGNNNGIFADSSIGGVTRIHNSVLQNPNSLNCDTTGGGEASAGGNFSTDNSCTFNNQGDQNGTNLNPMLGPLTKDPFGPTSYLLPLAGSPLIDNAVPNFTATDQRGAARVGNADIGAVEYGGMLPIVYLPFLSKKP